MTMTVANYLILEQIWCGQRNMMRCYVERLSVLMCLMVQKKCTQKRSAKWSQVVENLSSVQGMHFKVDNRAVRDRYNLLSMNLRRKVKREVK